MDFLAMGEEGRVNLKMCLGQTDEGAAARKAGGVENVGLEAVVAIVDMRRNRVRCPVSGLSW